MKTKKYLGYLGLAPFTLALFFENLITELFNRQALQVFLLYSAIILSFLAGTLWRQQNEKTDSQLPLLSNLFSLLAFFSLLMPYNLALIVLAVTYAALLYCEYYFNGTKLESRQYLSMRLQLTTLVVFMHIMAYVSWGV